LTFRKYLCIIFIEDERPPKSVHITLFVLQKVNVSAE